MLTTWALAVCISASPSDFDTPVRPFPLATVTVSVFSGTPEVIGGSAIINAIPYVDLEGSAAFELFGLAASLRAGPSFMVGDWRDDQNRGWTLRLSGLFGARWLRLWDHNSVGPNLVAAIDVTRWFRDHLGLTIRVSGGAFYEVEYAQFRPDLRLGIGLSF